MLVFQADSMKLWLVNRLSTHVDDRKQLVTKG